MPSFDVVSDFDAHEAANGVDQANREGKLKSGDLVSIVAFGGGLTWGSMLVRW